MATTLLCPHVPADPLRRFVPAAYGYRMPATPTGMHRGLPSRYLTLVIELHAPLRVTGAESAVTAHGVVGGLHTAPATIDASVPQQGLQYCLSPFAAEQLLGVPASALAELVVDLEDLAGHATAELIERLAEAATWAERFRLVDATLLRRLGERPPINDAVARAWHMTFATDGWVRVSELAKEVGWSRRHLSERFRQATGLTPKQAARIARFETARDLLLRPQRQPLARVAAEAGYADQPHLAREWKAFAGCSVSTWLREELPFLQDGMAIDPAPSTA